MNWNPIDTAPKDHYLLGWDLAKKQPVVMIWSMAESAFIPSFGGDTDISPRSWAPLPKFNEETWHPIASAPKDCFILAHDPALKRPYVVKWDRRKEAFVGADDLGDETPTHYLPIDIPI